MNLNLHKCGQQGVTTCWCYQTAMWLDVSLKQLLLEFIVKLPSPLTEWRFEKKKKQCLTAVQTGVPLGDRGYVLMRRPLRSSQLTVLCAPAVTECTMCVVKGNWMCLDTAGRKLLSRATVKIHNTLFYSLRSALEPQYHLKDMLQLNQCPTPQLTVQFTLLLPHCPALHQ